jgi:alpha-L-arabinofuranosidase
MQWSVSFISYVRLKTYLRRFAQFCKDEVQTYAGQHRRTAGESSPYGRKMWVNGI